MIQCTLGRITRPVGRCSTEDRLVFPPICRDLQPSLFRRVLAPRPHNLRQSDPHADRSSSPQELPQVCPGQGGRRGVLRSAGQVMSHVYNISFPRCHWSAPCDRVQQRRGGRDADRLWSESYRTSTWCLLHANRPTIG